MARGSGTPPLGRIDGLYRDQLNKMPRWQDGKMVCCYFNFASFIRAEIADLDWFLNAVTAALTTSERLARAPLEIISPRIMSSISRRFFSEKEMLIGFALLRIFELLGCSVDASIPAEPPCIKAVSSREAEGVLFLIG